MNDSMTLNEFFNEAFVAGEMLSEKAAMKHDLDLSSLTEKERNLVSGGISHGINGALLVLSRHGLLNIDVDEFMERFE